MLPRDRAWPSRSAARCPVRASSTASSYRPASPRTLDSHWKVVRNGVRVGRRVGGTAGLGEGAARLLQVAERAVERAEHQQRGRAQGVVAEPLGDVQGLRGVPPAVVEAERHELDERQGGQQAAAQRVRRAGRHQRDRLFQVVASPSVETALQPAAQAEQPGRPLRLGRRVQLVQRGGAVRHAGGRPARRERRRGRTFQHDRTVRRR